MKTKGTETFEVLYTAPDYSEDGGAIDMDSQESTDMVEEADAFDLEHESADLPDNVYSALHMYAASAAGYKRLTPEEEKELGTLIQRGKAADLRKTLNVNMSAEERTCADKEISRGNFARDKLITSNLRLVIYAAYKYQRITKYSADVMDMIQNGNLGLIDAASRFDPKKCCRFSTYAMCWIRGFIEAGMRNELYVNRITTRDYKKTRAVKKAVDALQAYTSNPDTAAIAKMTGIKEKKIQPILNLATGYVNIDFSCASEMKVFDRCDSNSEIEGEIEEKMIREKTLEIMKEVLLPSQLKVMDMLLGLTTGVPMILTDTASELGVTKQRVYNIKKKAIQRLNNTSAAMDLRTLLSGC